MTDAERVQLLFGFALCFSLSLLTGSLLNGLILGSLIPLRLPLRADQAERLAVPYRFIR
jgi:hypothetical protein